MKSNRHPIAPTTPNSPLEDVLEKLNLEKIILKLHPIEGHEEEHFTLEYPASLANFFSEFIKKEAERNKSQPRPFFRIELRATTDKENHFPGFVLCAPYSLVKEWIRAYSLKLSVWLELERLRFTCRRYCTIQEHAYSDAVVTIFVEGIKVAGQILKRGTDRAVEWRDLAESLSYALSVLNNPTKEAIEALTKVAQKIAPGKPVYWKKWVVL